MSDSFDPMDCSPPAPLSMDFSRQEYWSRVPCPPPGDLPKSGTEPMSPALEEDFLLLSHWGSPLDTTLSILIYYLI